MWLPIAYACTKRVLALHLQQFRDLVQHVRDIRIRRQLSLWHGAHT